MDKLKLGIIGSSEGNGHPFSWSAIFNGYDPSEMKKCGYPVISEYLSKKSYPNDYLTDLAEVTHVWTQDNKLSEQIAKSSHIRTIVSKPENMIGEVDAILLARDDAMNHVSMTKAFLHAGLPIFIDKPFALSLGDADIMFSRQQFDEQIFTCSSLRFSNELMLTCKEKEKIGEICYVEGSVMNKWETYGMHIIEPLVSQLPNRGPLKNVKSLKSRDVQAILIKWDNCIANLIITGKIPSKLELSFFSSHSKLTKTFSDSFTCFKNSLKTFIEQIQTRKQAIPRIETLELVEIIERGIC